MRFRSIVLVLLMGCGTSGDPVAIPVVADYFPLTTGAWFIYAVDSVVTDQNIATPWSYDLKVVVIDSFPNSDGDFTYVLQRAKRVVADAPWTSLSTWSVRVNEFQAVVMEANIAYVKISGPLTEGKAWNGNALNTLGGTERCPGTADLTCDVYTLKDVGKPYTAAGISYPESLTVIQHDDEGTIVSQDIRSEVYARKVGLVDRVIIQYQYCNSSDCYGQQKIDKGLQYHQTLKQYGNL